MSILLVTRVHRPVHLEPMRKRFLPHVPVLKALNLRLNLLPGLFKSYRDAVGYAELRGGSILRSERS